MLLVVAHKWDPRGAALRQAWPGAGLLTPVDLSQRGWSFDPAAPEAGRAVIGGRRVAAGDIRGVCVLLPAVTENDLPHIVAADRGYVAAEMTAFLCAWLTCLPCPKVNPPSPAGLSGPNWRTERWICTAARLGLPVRGAARSAAPRTGGPRDGKPVSGQARRTVVVAGDEVFGETRESPAGWAARLAGAADARLLNVHIGADERESYVLGADVWADVGRPAVAEALRRELTGRAP